MKSISNLLKFGAMALLFTACSSDNVPDGPNPANPSESTGKGYIGIQLRMPEVSNSTRADNDNFDDGTPNEYKVENCALVLFKGSSESGKTESDATFQGFYDITAAFQKTPSSTGNITSSAFEVREVNNIDLKR